MKQALKQGAKNRIGAIGESLAQEELERRGFKIIDQNYLKPWGEIDIVARESDMIVFVEVKTVSYETKEKLDHAVTRETWRPEENVHPEKLRRLGRVLQTWIAENGYTGNWKFMIATVRVVPRERIARISLLEDVIPE
jgi:putative endonuclease